MHHLYSLLSLCLFGFLLLGVLADEPFSSSRRTAVSTSFPSCVITPDAISGVTSVELTVRLERHRLASPSSSSSSRAKDDAVPPVHFTSRVFYSPSCNNHSSSVIADSSSSSLPPFSIGPIIVVKPGGVLNITIVNRLPEVAPRHISRLGEKGPFRGNIDEGEASRHRFRERVNSINIHTHGLHVDPAVDNPFRVIDPQTNGSYWIKIPTNHPPGTHWYHTHIHGVVSLQLMGGLYGAIVVDDEPEVAMWRQRVALATLPRGSHSPSSSVSGVGRFRSAIGWSLPLRSNEVSFRSHALRKHHVDRHVMAISLLKFRSRRLHSPHSGWSFSDLDEELHSTDLANATVDVDLVVVNGQLQPTLRVTRGRAFMLHLIFASAFGEIALHLPNTCRAAIVAADGISYHEPRRAQVLQFVCATRYDVLMDCDHVGVMRVLHGPASPNLDDVGYYVPRFSAAPEYMAKVRQLGIEDAVLFNIETHEPTATASSSPSAGNHHEHFEKIMEESKHMSFQLPLRDLHSLPSAQVALRRDITMSQMFSREVITKDDHAFEVSTGSQRIYSIGQGENCDFQAPLDKQNCTVRMFQGSRGNKTSEYHGFVVPLGKIVEARLLGDPFDEKAHPLHFHVNHFQLVDYIPPRRSNGLNNEDITLRKVSALRAWGLRIGDWRDTIPVLPGATLIRFRVSDFSGEIVYHCHTSSHEDLGMMDSFYVLPASSLDGSHPKRIKYLQSHYSVVASAGREVAAASSSDVRPTSGTISWPLALPLVLLMIVIGLWYSRLRGAR